MILALTLKHKIETFYSGFTALRQVSLVSIVAVGEMLVMLLGTMDVSLAAILGFAGVVTAGLIADGLWPPLVACLVGEAAGGAIGQVNGLAFTYAQGQTIYGDALSSIAFLARGYLAQLPAPVLLMFVI